VKLHTKNRSTSPIFLRISIRHRRFIDFKDAISTQHYWKQPLFLVNDVMSQRAWPCRAAACRKCADDNVGTVYTGDFWKVKPRQQLVISKKINPLSITNKKFK